MSKNKKLAIILGVATGTGALIAVGAHFLWKHLKEELETLNFEDDVEWFYKGCKGNIPLK